MCEFGVTWRDGSRGLGGAGAPDEKPISPPRRRMIEDVTVRNFIEKTRHGYIRRLTTFTSFLGAGIRALPRFFGHQPFQAKPPVV
jgi:hypothetical protein